MGAIFHKGVKYAGSPRDKSIVKHETAVSITPSGTSHTVVFPVGRVILGARISGAAYQPLLVTTRTDDSTYLYTSRGYYSLTSSGLTFNQFSDSDVTIDYDYIEA